MANYFVKGADQNEYGPVSPEELQKWIAEGRVDASTRVREENSAAWNPVSAVPELAGLFKPGAPGTIGAVNAPVTQKNSSMAVASLVFGILGLFTCGLLAVLGLVFGIISLVKISNSRGTLRGKGMAIAGTVVSCVFIFMIPIFLALTLPALAAAKQKAMEINCMNNERQLALAVRIYTDSHTNHYPAAAHWCDAIKTNVGANKTFACPAANDLSHASDHCDYAFNDRLDGVASDKVNPMTVVLFEADGGWNAHGGVTEATAFRHRPRAMNVAFADGHVERVSESRLDSLRWDP